jgi:hypothetical protein
MLRSCAVVIFVLLAASALLPVSALAQGVMQNVPPSPGTIEDSSKPIKLIADGPPRPLFKTDLRDKGPVIVAMKTGSETR